MWIYLVVIETENEDGTFTDMESCVSANSMTAVYNDYAIEDMDERMNITSINRLRPLVRSIQGE